MTSDDIHLPPSPGEEPQGPPSVLSSAPDLASLAKALKRRWLLAIMLGTVSAVIAGTAARLFVPTKYVARALMDVAANPPKIIFSTSENRTDPFHTFQRKQAALVKSRPLLAAALRNPKAAALPVVRQQLEPVEWLEGHLQADYSVAPEILRISLAGDKPQELITLVDAVAEAYLQEVVNKEHKRRLERLDQLKELYNTYDDGLRRKRQALRDLAESAGSGDAKTLALKHRFAIEQLALAEKELMDLQSQLRKLQVEVTDQQVREKALAAAAVPEGVLEEHVKKDKAVEQQTKRVSDLEDSVASLKRVTARGDSDPALKKLRADLDAAKELLETTRAEARPRVLKELREKARLDLSNNLATLQGRQVLLSQHEKALNEVIERLRHESQAMNKSGLSLGSLQDEIVRAENLVKTVATEIDALNVELQAPPRVTLLESAAISQSDSLRRQLLAIGAAALTGLFFALAGLAWWEFRTRRVDTVDEVVHGLGVRLIGSVPHVPSQVQYNLTVGGGGPDPYWQNLLIESVTAVRMMLLRAATTEPLRLVMITSATVGEGKTSLSSHLAVSLARAGRKTLLVDCDMRRPAVHRVFDLPLEPGLGELLAGEADVPDVLRPSPLEDLWIMSAGKPNGLASHALAGPTLPALFQRLRDQFDFVLIDACPVLPVADTLLVGQHVDGVIFTLLRDVSRLPQVYAGYQRLTSMGIRVLGIVVNGAGGGSYGSAYTEYSYVSPGAH